MTRDRDVQAFDDRALAYETGYRGQFHIDVVNRAVNLALAHCPSPARILDVGCGTGMALRELARRLPGAVTLAGVDAAAGMIGQARAKSGDPRLTFVQAAAERLPFGDATFDLVISTTSFDHWADQRAGLAECHRVLAPRGSFVLADLCSNWLLPTLVGGRGDRARTPLRATRLLAAAGFRSLTWHRLHAGIIRAVTASAQR
ncbi:MAG TPA: class I SAM-dependent methyltransferase [Streptosporangiaceae bacterium]